METFGKQKDNKELLHLIDKHGRYCSLESVFLKSVIVSGSICVGVSAFVFVLSLNPDSPPQQPLFLQSLSLFTFPVGFGIATLLNGHSKKEKFMNVLILYNSLN